MASGAGRPLALVVGGGARAGLLRAGHPGEVGQAAIELLQGCLQERSGARLPERVVQDTHSESSPDDLLTLCVGTLAQIEEWPPARRWAQELRDTIGPEGFYLGLPDIAGSPPVVMVAGADERGVLYGVGRLLRSLRFAGRDVIAEIGETRSTPAIPVRGHLLANHLWSPQYDNWDEKVWDRYLADLALWGVNTLLTTPYHPGEWAACRPFDDPPLFRQEGVRRAWEFTWQVQRAIPRLARRWGMRFGLWIPPNDVPVDEARPQTEGGRCDNVCPSQLDMRALILRHREAVFEALDPIDLVVVPASDCGGCSCSACAPWVKTYLRLAEETAARLHRFHPEAWMGISNQNLSPAEDDWLFACLEEQRPDWLRFVVHGPGSSDPASMRRRLPPEYDLFLYPDITHLAAGVGYLFEDLPTDPLVWRVCQQAHLEATPFARPEAVARAYPRYRAHGQGSFPYSEGTQDDLNKVIWSQLDWEPDADVSEIVRDYCAFYFSAGLADALSQVWYRLERSLTADPGDNSDIPTTLAMMEDARGRLPGWALHGWRWQMLEVRVLLDRFLQLYRVMDRRVEEALGACGEMGEPQIAVRDLAARVRDAGPRPVLDDLRLDLGAMFPYFPGAQAARRDRMEGGEPPSHPLQARLDSWTPDLREMEALDHRIQALAFELRRAIGLELRAAWIIRGAKTSYDRRLDDLEAIACGPQAGRRLAQEIAWTLDPEQAPEGGAYDDLGHPDRQPHLQQGQRWEDAFGDIFLGERPAAERRAISPWGEGLVLNYRGLRVDVPYRLQVTYVQSRSETRSQRLVAVTGAGSFEVHPPILLPTRPRRYAFTLPVGVISNGELELRFVRAAGRPHNAVASEVRLTPVTE